MKNRIGKKRNHLIHIALFLVSLPIVGWCAEGAHLSLPDSVFNFGYVQRGAMVSHTFQLCSTGDDTLQIIKVRPG
jgi:hypothetical protein